MNAQYIKYRETKLRWARENKDRVNAQRRKRRAELKAERMSGKFCRLCEIKMKDHSFGGWEYCKDCRERFRKDVETHKWAMFYKKRIYRPFYRQRYFKLKNSLKTNTAPPI